MSTECLNQANIGKRGELYDRAYQAAEAGDWSLSCRLLERCCKLALFRDTRLNSLWMVAADRSLCGDPGGMALPLAISAWQAGVPGKAMAFLQLALYRQPKEFEKAEEAMRLAVEWPAKVAAVSALSLALKPGGVSGGKLRIGHLVGCLNPIHAPTKLIQILTGELSPESVQSFVYASEWASNWFHNWSFDRQSGPEEFLSTLKDAKVFIQEARGGFLERALRLAQRIAQDNLDLLVVHASNIEMVTALTAAFRPARCIVNVNHCHEMVLPGIDGYVHMYACQMRRSKVPEKPATTIYPATDMSDRLRTAPRLDRQTLGIPPAATVSATIGNLYKVETTLYLESLRGLMAAHPCHHHLLVGGGDQCKLRQLLQQYGLESRVHLLGPRTDIPSLLLLLDFYLASHPFPGALTEIEAMAAGCPVISMRWDPESQNNAGAEVVALAECLVDKGDSAAVAALAHRFLSDKDRAREIGTRLKKRYEAHFRPAAAAAKHLEFYRSVLSANPGLSPKGVGGP